MNVGFLAALGAAMVMSGVTAFDIYCYVNHRNYLKKCEKEKRERMNAIGYNKTYPPSKYLPTLSPDLDKLEEIVKRSSGLVLKDVGDSYACIVVYASENYKQRIISKSELDDDTAKLIELLLKDIDWFYAHPTDNSLGECSAALENFLREKYPMLSVNSVGIICNRYCVINR